jgi:hypothetical protein
MKIAYITAILATSMIIGCKPMPKDEFAEIGPSETAFLIALDGNTQANQSKLNSVEFLEHNKVQAKRITIPGVAVDKCPSCAVSDWEIMPSARLIKINRAPVSREWTASSGTGTNSKNEAIRVETNESIDFSIGATITAHVSEEGAAKFLYYYAGKQLEEIIDGNVRSFIATNIARQMGSHNLEWCRTSKVAVFDTALANARTFFGERGIVIDNLGFTDGMTYSDKAIQDAINRKFAADMQVQTAQQEAAAAEVIARAGQSYLTQQGFELRKKELDIIDKHWNGAFSLYGGQSLQLTVPSTK